jgi:hypothetical protein
MRLNKHDSYYTYYETPFYNWTKKLGQWHLHLKDGVTLCGSPMLGNNYTQDIPESEREKCEECFKKAETL